MVCPVVGYVVLRLQRAHWCVVVPWYAAACLSAMVTSQWTTQDSPVTVMVRGYLCVGGGAEFNAIAR